MTTPCCAARRSVSTCVHQRWTSTVWPIPLVWLVTPQTLLTRGASVVNILEWDCSNGKSVRGAVRNFSRQDPTANGVQNVGVRISCKPARNTGTARTSKRATTRLGRTTMRGGAEALHLRIKRSPMTSTAECVDDAEVMQCSSTTRMGTGTIPTSTISNHYASGAISCTTTARKICRSSARRRHSQYPTKVGNSTLNYGMGANKLGRQIGSSKEDAQKKIDTYKATYPAVDRFFKESVEETKRTGYAFTILGRRRNVPEIGSYRHDEESLGERISINTAIQGSAADVCKMAQVHIDRMDFKKQYGCRMLLQIHDELVFECPKEVAAEVIPEIQELMEHPFSQDLAVALTVDIGQGPNWGSSK